MSFIGIIAENKFFENVKTNIEKNINDKKLNILNVNINSIENIKNIKFDIIIINTNLKKFENKKDILEKICSQAKYIILNSDIELGLNLLENETLNIITYGLNHKSTVTISSLTQSNILVYLQRNIKNMHEQIIEVEEKQIEIDEKLKLKTYEILVIYIISIIYNKKVC